MICLCSGPSAAIAGEPHYPMQVVDEAPHGGFRPNPRFLPGREPSFADNPGSGYST
jgi:hypothetical protein